MLIAIEHVRLWNCTWKSNSRLHSTAGQWSLWTCFSRHIESWEPCRIGCCESIENRYKFLVYSYRINITQASALSICTRRSAPYMILESKFVMLLFTFTLLERVCILVQQARQHCQYGRLHYTLASALPCHGVLRQRWSSLATTQLSSVAWD